MDVLAREVYLGAGEGGDVATTLLVTIPSQWTVGIQLKVSLKVSNGARQFLCNVPAGMRGGQSLHVRVKKTGSTKEDIAQAERATKEAVKAAVAQERAAKKAKASVAEAAVAYCINAIMTDGAMKKRRRKEGKPGKNADGSECKVRPRPLQCALAHRAAEPISCGRAHFVTSFAHAAMPALTGQPRRTMQAAPRGETQRHGGGTVEDCAL